MSKRQHGYIPEFDGMRALAILLVIVFHVWRYVGDAPVGRAVSAVASTGWSGVDIFFVLSGFLITGILLNTKDRPDYWSRFYIRRSLRIFPLYYAVMTAILIGAWAINQAGIDINEPALQATDKMWINYLYLTNFAKAFYGADFVPLDIAWSLAIEEQFYLVFPFIVRFASKLTLKRILWAVVILAPLFRWQAFVMFDGRYDPPYVLPQCRMDALAVGALVLLLFRDGSDLAVKRVAQSALLLAPAAIAFLLFTKRGDLSFVIAGYSVVAFASAAGVVWVLEHPASWLAGLFRRPSLIYIGKVSYGLYLLHLIVRGGVDLGLGSMKAGMAESVWLAALRLGLVVALSIVAASLSYYLFEKPILKLKDRFTPSRSRESLIPSDS